MELNDPGPGCCCPEEGDQFEEREEVRVRALCGLDALKEEGLQPAW